MIREEADLRALRGPALVALYNALRAEGSPEVRRFATIADAARRTWALLDARPAKALPSNGAAAIAVAMTERERLAFEMTGRADGATLAELTRGLGMTKGSVRNLMGDLRRRHQVDVHPRTIREGRRAYVVAPPKAGGSA